MRACSRATLVFALSGLVALAGCASEDTHVDSSEGSLQASPQDLTFRSASLDSSEDLTVTLTNVGAGDLEITQISLDTTSPLFDLASAETPIRLAPSESHELAVWFKPSDCNASANRLFIRSTDRNRPVVIVPIRTLELLGRTIAVPESVDFGRVAVGERAAQGVSLINQGECDVDIFDLLVDPDGPSGGFSLDEGAATTLAPDGRADIVLGFEPVVEGAAEGTLEVRLRGFTESDKLDVPLWANATVPCISVSDEAGIDFGERAAGVTATREVTIQNCSRDADLRVGAVRMDRHFSLGGADRFGLDGLPDLSQPAALSPGQTMDFDLTYRPGLCDGVTCSELDGALLTIVSDDEAKSPLQIEVTGRATDNECPTAIARARVAGAGEEDWATRLTAPRLATIELDATESFDPDGDVVDYTWEVVERPGGVERLEPSDSLARPTFFLSVMGEYAFRLVAFDDRGTPSCDAATVYVTAVGDGGIVVEMLWDTPGDPDPFDVGAGTGSDVDLHFLHPNGTWDESPWDCNWKNKNPNWGDMTSREDDPDLDIDDTDGWGPETIKLRIPEGTAAAPAIYRVGAYYYSDHLFGPSDVTIRVYLDSALSLETTFPRLEDRQFWDVARIAWPTRDIEVVNRLYPSGFPY